MKSNMLHLRQAILCFVFLFGIIGGDWGQTTVTYDMQDANFPIQFSSGGDFFNQGSTELGMWANTGAKQTVAWRTFKTSGDNTGSDRSLQIGDVLIVTVSATRAFGQIGFSLNAGGTSGTNYLNRTSGSRLYFNTDNYGAWYVYRSGGNSSLSYTPIQNTFKNYIFTIKITSATTANVYLTVDGIDYRAFNITMNGSGNIDAFSIYGSDMWDGDSDENAFWKQTATVTNSGSVELGYYLTSGTFSPGLITNGLAANSTSTSSTNAVNIGGDAGSNIVLSQANTYTGLTTINANATLKLGASSSTSASGPVGTTAAGTTITSGGVLDMNGFSLTSTATEALSISGTGISSGGALINTSGTGSTWTGTVALGAVASVGGSGNITLNGVISGANNLTKIGAGTLTLGTTNTFGGTSKSLIIAAGTVAITSFTDNLGNSNNTFTLGAASTSGTLDITPSATGSVFRSFTVAAGGGTIKNSGTNTPTFLTSSGTYTGTLNGELTVNCASSGDIQCNLGISGAGGITVNNSSTGKLIMGTLGAAASTYTGDTKLTAGTLQLGTANILPNARLVLNGGTFSTGASTGYAETIGTLQLTDNSTIALGTGSHTINFSASNSIAWTASKTLTITGWTGTVSGGTAGRIYLGTSSSGLTQAQLDAITFSGAANSGAQILSTGEIVPNFSETITSSTSGNWNSTNTWVGGVVPTSVDNVVIASSHTVTVSADATCKKINFTGTGGVVSVNTGITLTVSTSVNVDQADQNNAGTISGLGTLTCTSINVGTSVPSLTAGRTTTLTSTISTLTSTGSITLTSRNFSSNNNNPLFYLQSGTLTCTNVTTVHPSGTNTATISLATGAATGTLKLSGSSPFTLDTDGTNTITLNGTAATVEYSGTAQTVLNTPYTNLTLSGSGNKITAAFSISGTLSIQGTAAAITTAPSFGASSTLEYKNAGNRTTTAIEWPSSSGPANLIIDNSGSTVTMLGSANRTLSGNLTLTGGTLADAGNILTVQGNIAGAGTQTGAGSIAMTGASKTISGATLGNVTLNNASGFSLSGSPTINGALTFTLGKLSLGANTLNLAGTVASMTTTNSITGSSTSNLSITGSGTLGVLLLNQTTAGTTNTLNNLTINRSSTGVVNIGSALNLVGNLTVTNGSFRSFGGNTLTMAGTTQTLTISNASGGSVLGTDNSAGNDLTLAIANGSTTTLAGDATSTNDDDKKFFNVTVNTGGTFILSRGILCKWGTFAVNGTLQINSNGYLQSTPTGGGSAIAPTYGSSSLLKYNSANSYGRGLEWSSTSGAGYPHHVQISNNTTLNFANGSNTPRSIAGNLTIDAASTLTMESLTTNSSTIGLTVGGNINNSGTISMSATTERIKCTDFTNIGGSTTNLSTEIGGDLEVTGNLVENGNLNSSSRAVFFTGTGTQDVQGSGTFSIDYIVLNKVSGSVRLLCDLICEGPNGGNAMTLTNATDIIDLNVYALTIGKAAVNSGITGLGYVKTSSSSSLTIRGTGNFGTLNFDPSSTAIGSFTLNRTETNAGATIGGHLTATNLTITSGNLTITAGKQLTINGNLTNNGILTLNSGATLVQGTSSNLFGTGTYNVKQNITGTGGSTPNGRFWYLGSPLSNGLSTALHSSTGNLLWEWNESGFTYATVPTGQQLTQGKSYVLRSGQSETINFSGTGLSNGTVPVSGLTRSGTTQNYRGCHLISNPYPSYLDWDMVGKTQVSTTMYVRTASNSSIDVLETYNSYNGQGTSISGPAMTKFIAPMQGFWVKVETDGQTGSLSMTNAMRSHQASGAGLRSSAIDFPAYLRFNMIDGQNKDQVILLMSPDASMSLDDFDSEKMSASGYAQFYSTVNAKKLVINGMKNVKAKTSVPLTLVMPTSKSYTFQAEEFNIEDGLILLEDKQEGVIQDLTINPTYSFFGNAGTNATRFVVHFQLASAPVLVGGPQELESLGSEELMSENIQIVSNNQGTVIIRLDEGFKPEGFIRIFDASGRLVEQTDFNDQETTIQLNEQAGMYFVEVSVAKLMVKKKIVIE
jgi:hypothetical protein